MTSKARELLFQASRNERCADYIAAAAQEAVRNGQAISPDVLEGINSIRAAADFMRKCGRLLLHEEMKNDASEDSYDDN